MFLRKTAGTALFAAAAVSAAKETNNDEESKKTILRPKELPIYSTVQGSAK